MGQGERVVSGDPEVSSTRLGIYHAIGKEQQERLDQAAATIVDALREGSYQAP